ncbi:phosphopantetheine-binding protein, partial [Streptomyces sp. DSM 44915]
SHTLAVGRHHFAHRCAVVAHDRDDAVRLLRAAAEGEKPRKVYQGVADRDFTPNAAVETVIREMIEEAAGNQSDATRYQELLQALADFYCQGYAPRLQDLFAQAPVRISLPTQAFEPRHCWVDALPARPVLPTLAPPAPAPLAPPAPAPVAAAPVATPRPAPKPTPAPAVVAPPAVPRGGAGAVSLRPVAEVAAEMARTKAPAAPRRITLAPLTPAAKPTPTPIPASTPAAKPTAPTPVTQPAAPATTSGPDAEELLEALRVSLARELFVEVDEVDVERSFTELGLDSVVGVEWIRAVNGEFGTSVGTTKIYQYPSVREFATFLLKELPAAPPGAEPPVAPAPEDDLDEVLAQVYEGEIDVWQAEARLSEHTKEA